ncbi:DUF1430 domain-containing protein [Clostridium sp. MSJ-4]|uniref:DUF1430 domain-containing protein n=1 Tax=Clostridium simiarum TaxID=2841506 RepID=A0ABS6F230_9CLOT|nr:DUF1430 domain-containing protein [Clostridium simiarum]
MKKNIFLAIIFIFITTMSFNSLFYEEKYNQYNKMINLGDRSNTTKVVISIGEKKPTEVYEILKFYLKKYNGNLYCSYVLDDGNDSKYIDYIMFANSDIFKNIKLNNGRFMNDFESESNKYLSTKKTNDENQIGQICDFTGKNYFEIRTLKSKLDSNIFSRNFYITMPNKSDFEKFVKDLNLEGIHLINSGNDTLNDPDNSAYKIISVVCYFVMVLLIVYNILNSYKSIAIEKMLGFNKKNILAKRIFPIIKIEILSILITTLILILINFKVYNLYFFNFLNKLLQIYAVMIIASIILISLPFMFINFIKISNMLKNKKPIKFIIYFNTFIKIIFTVIFIVLSINCYSKYQIIKSSFSYSYENWEKTREYYIVPEMQTTTNIGDPYNLEYRQKEKELYYTFNKSGSILADFRSFMPGYYEKEKSSANNETYKIDTITINPNYLKENKVLDENNNRVNILENDKEYILLVPEKYHSKEKEIIEYNEFIKEGYNSKEEEIKNKPKSIVAKQNIKIIWIKDNQKFFSYLIDVNPVDGNMVSDPIARVLTESNGDLSDYSVLFGFKSNPFKIKVGDSSNSIETILDNIKKYFDFNIYRFPVFSLYSSVQEQIRNTKQNIQFMILIMLILFIGIMTIILQNVINYFEQNKVRLAIQKFHGYKKISKYKSYFIGIFLNWILVSVISILIIKSVKIFPFIVILIIIEYIISFLFLNFVETRKVIKVTKGG